MSLGRRIDRRRIHIFRLMLSFAPFIYTIHAQTSAQPNNYWTVHGFRIWVHYFYYICSSCSRNMVEIKTQRRKYLLSRSFAESIKKETLCDQNCKYAFCRRSTGLWDYDRIDGNRSHNDYSNCQALCINCHAEKTRELLKQQRKSHFLR